MSEPATERTDTTNALQLYASFPFSTDDAYQQGLASIVAGGALDGNPPDLQEEILRRTRVFYFNRLNGNSITMDEAREFEHSLQPTNASSIVPPIPPTFSSSPDNTDETRTLTFAELKELIETGKVDQIPNNKVIPEALNDASPSDSTVPVRKKPWELAAAAESS